MADWTPYILIGFTVVLAIIGWVINRQVGRLDQIEEDVKSIDKTLDTLKTEHGLDHRWLQDHNDTLKKLNDTKVQVDLMLAGKVVIIEPNKGGNG